MTRHSISVAWRGTPFLALPRNRAAEYVFWRPEDAGEPWRSLPAAEFWRVFTEVEA